MIKCSTVSKSFGSREVIKNVSFEVKKGEIFGLLGPSGAGKTTLIRMLTGRLEPGSGDAEIAFEDSPAVTTSKPSGSTVTETNRSENNGTASASTPETAKTTTPAKATAVTTYLALNGKSKEEIRQYITDNYYKIDFTLDEIRESYQFDESCQGTMPQALEAFFEAESYEDSIRNAISDRKSTRLNSSH